MLRPVFGFHCLHDCLCMSSAAEPYVLHLRAPLGSFFITSMLLSPCSKWPPMLHELNGNTTPFGPKLSKYGARPIWSRLPTPWGLAQITVHHFPNSVSSSSIIGTQQRLIKVLLIFSLSLSLLCLFKPLKCFSMANVITSGTSCAKCCQGQDPHCLYWPCTENVVLWAVESTRFRLYMPLLCDLNIKSIIF